MKYQFELTPFEQELKNWYLSHQELMPWDLFLLKEKEIRKKYDIASEPYHAIDPCCRQYEDAIYDKNHGFVNFKNLQFLASGHYCSLTRQPRYFPEVPFESASPLIFYVYHGEGTVTLKNESGEETYHLKEGDFLLTPQNTRKTILCKSDASVVLYLALSSRLMSLAAYDNLPSVLMAGSSDDHTYPPNEILYYSTGNDPKILSLINDMISESVEQKQDYNPLLFHLLQILLIYLQREYKNKCQDSKISRHSYIPEFRKYLRDHFNDFSLQQMAKEFHLSASYICRLYKQHTGATLLETLQEIRIQMAEYLLKNTYDSIENIAFRVGYGDTSYFIEAFRKRTGSTPGKYRK